MFKPRMARRTLDRFRKKGHGDLERRMLRAASGDGVAGARVLEIGGGIGTLQAALLVEGAQQGEVVELVSAWEPYARELAREQGIEERTSFRVADVLEQPGSVAPADVVLMNRVVCCTPDGVELTGLAAQLASRTLVLSFPRDRLLIRIGVRLVNASLWIRRSSFRVFLHPRDALLGAASAGGLELEDEGAEGLWEYAALVRA